MTEPMIHKASESEKNSVINFLMGEKQDPNVCNHRMISFHSKSGTDGFDGNYGSLVGKCLDCGSVNSPRFCPNCGIKQIGDVWKHWDGRIKCNSCGFTITDSIMCNIGSNFKGKNKQGKLGTKKSKMKSKKYMSKRKQKKLDAKNKVHPNKIL